MKKITFILALMLMRGYVFSQTVTVNITPADKKQTIRGVGGAHHYASDLDLMFGDAGWSCYRVYAGPNGMGGYWDEPVNDNADANSIDTSKFTNPSAENITALKNAVKAGATCFLTIMQPPYWMKDMTQKSINQPGCQDCGGILRADMYNEFAEFALGVAMKFKGLTGTDLYAISVQNEPEFTEPYWSCVYTGQQMVDAAKAIALKFQANGIPTKILYAEQTFTQNNFLPWAVLANNDAALQSHICAFADHAYSEDPMGGGMSSPLGWAALYKEAIRVSPAKETWMTEGGAGVGSGSTVLNQTIGGADEFYKAMKYGNASLWCFDQLREGVPLVRYFVKGTCRYIRPGAYRVQASVASAADTNRILPLAFKHDALGAFTIYLVNKSTSDRTVKINLTGSPGKFDAFETSEKHYCDWVGEFDPANEIVVPAMSITTMINVASNKLPDIDPIDTIVILKNSGTKQVDLTNINDGGEGGQKLSVKAWAREDGLQLFSSVTTTYTSPGSTGKLNLSPKTDMVGNTDVYLAVNDSSSALNKMFNEKVISVPVYVIPYINKAPTMNDIDDRVYTKSQINSTQLVTLTNVSDGNDGKQKLTLSAVSSAPWIATVATQGSTLVKITPIAEGIVTITVTLADDGVNLGGGSGSITKTFTVVIGSGINSIEEFRKESLIYPNPASDVVNLMVSAELVNAGLKIINSVGQTMMEQKLTGNQSTFNVSSLPAGTYFINISNNSSQAKLMFVKK